MPSLIRITIAIQSGYYLLTGIWPLVHLASFEAVTGPKTDRWLVRTVGGLAVAIAAGLVAGIYGRRPPRETVVLSVASAAAFGAASAVSVLTAGISLVYLADAAVELLFIVGVMVGLMIARRPSRTLV